MSRVPMSSHPGRGAAIERAAEQLLATSSFDAIRVEELTEAVGVSKPVFYEHFSSKKALGVRLSMMWLREAFDEIRVLRTNSASADALRSFIAWALKRQFASGYGFARLLVRSENPSIKVADQRWQSELEQLIALAQSAKTIRSTAPARIIANTFRSILRDTAFDQALSDGSVQLEILTQGVTQLLLD